MSWGDIGHSQAREGIVTLFSALGQAPLEFWGQFWSPQYKKDIKLIESVQGRV